MKHNRARQLDMQLLQAFVLLYEERGLGRAATRLNLSQPAMSRVLVKLRDIFADPLFLRSAEGLQPTARAEQLLPQIQSAITQMLALLGETRYQPATDQGRLIVSCNDFAASRLLPAICKHIQRQAPGLAMDIRPWTADLTSTLSSTPIEMALCLNEPCAADICVQVLHQDNYVVAMCADNPLACRPLDMHSYLQAEHILIPLGVKQQGAMETLLANQGIQRRVSLRIPYLMAALAMLPGSHYLLIIPEWVARSYQAQFNLSWQAVPFATPLAEYCLIWPTRLDNDPRQRWARTQALDAIHSQFQADNQPLGQLNATR
ncbi:LysR family transcriptional regulator [Bowmanella sp. Y26]|uniref:LysR family transcriptional regulator n=1 Tax=Bowmanella yangjiangensis TaxID=2811230 RepID=UPI001BDC8446|nr:LysR family transcriptional regulator [Bowmanella yangjiangensis]MBT1064710.1 LysR family transcriptional regulator [Bowmanella yangjiangensis]